MNNSPRPLFQQKQYEFTAWLRDPERATPPQGQEQRRIAVYRDLLFNNVLGFVSNAFPVLESFYPQRQWQTLVRAFFSHYYCHSPYFRDIPQQFIDFLQNHYQKNPADPPFMLELAHYEWLELALDIAEEENPPGSYDPNGDLLQGIPLLSSLVVLQAYQWPVHRLDAQHYRPTTPPPQPSWLIIYRDRKEKVCFIEANVVTARLLELLQANDQSCGQQLLQQIATESAQAGNQAIIKHGQKALEDFHRLGIILGTAGYKPA